jgi:hypothetical protein
MSSGVCRTTATNIAPHVPRVAKVVFRSPVLAANSHTEMTCDCDAAGTQKTSGGCGHGRSARAATEIAPQG